MTDRYPEYMSGTTTMSAANTFTTESINLPIVRTTAGRGRQRIMEFLWVDCRITGFEFNDDADEVNFSITVGSPPTAQKTLSNSECVAFLSGITHLDAAGGGTPSSLSTLFPWRYDMQDKLGFGQLVATDRININLGSNGQTGANTWQWRIYYRWVSVSLEEYLGIVQSQLSATL